MGYLQNGLKSMHPNKSIDFIEGDSISHRLTHIIVVVAELNIWIIATVGDAFRNGVRGVLSPHEPFGTPLIFALAVGIDGHNRVGASAINMVPIVLKIGNPL